ncbi:hypothetical protein Vadar_013438 [Vaccinium darrowii]|uniref:Uncharacterized protein n=1 Tax=Vaccinium darrowii TaxID=229202 RepID=A0ACB7Y021_9ERIC|nr:hypothetical protein Vadar_013438 [Vaccinium darrowii]
MPSEMNNTNTILYYVLFGGERVSATTFTLENRCSNTIWPGTLTADNGAALGGGGFSLAPGASTQLSAPAGWSGRFWPRTGCNFDGSGNGKCDTGDCGKLMCTGAGIPPVTLAEFTIGGDKDFYDVSLVDGYNVGLGIRTSGGTGSCRYTSCASDVNKNCPTELQVTNAGSVIACKSACMAFNTPEYCCTGDHSTPQTCSPTQYSQIFKNACPSAYSYAYDDPSRSRVSATVFTLQNLCSYTVWAGTLCGNGKAVLGGGGFALAPSASTQFSAPPGWSGRFWARTDCNFDATSNGICVTGDCGGKLQCTGSGVPPATLAEFTSGNTSNTKDFYDVSLVDGYNVGIGIQTSGGTGDCRYAGCIADLNKSCPPELQVINNGSVVACKSACAAFEMEADNPNGNVPPPNPPLVVPTAVPLGPVALPVNHSEKPEKFNDAGLKYRPLNLPSKTFVATQFGLAHYAATVSPSLAVAALHWPLLHQPNSRLHPVGRAGFGPEQVATLTDQAMEYATLATVVASFSALDRGATSHPHRIYHRQWYNVGIGIQTFGSTGDCRYAGCIADLNQNCLPELQVVNAGSVIACKSACAAFGTPEYCCSGACNTPATCPPTNYSELFKNACPNAYSYAYDDASSTFTCTGADYLITLGETGSNSKVADGDLAANLAETAEVAMSHRLDEFCLARRDNNVEAHGEGVLRLVDSNDGILFSWK